jgi:hypothetical protein
MLGRQFYPLLTEAGFDDARVDPRVVSVDSSRPEIVDEFILKTITAMIEGVQEPAIAAGLIDAARLGHPHGALQPLTGWQVGRRSDQAVLVGGDDGLDPVAQVEFG